MTLQKVDSTSIRAVGYDPETQVLTVEFRSGRTYEYSDVPLKKHADFMASNSKGKHLNKHIRDAHPCKEKVA